MGKLMAIDHWHVRRTVLRPLFEMWRLHAPHVELGALLSKAMCSNEAIAIEFSKVHAHDRIETLRARLEPDRSPPMAGPKSSG